MGRARLTKAQRRALERLATVKEGSVLRCSGHLRGACGVLALKGYAAWFGNDNGLCAFFSITDKGRAALAEDGGGHG